MECYWDTGNAGQQSPGIVYGENQAALTKKVEELTLYSIELEKKVTAQNNLLELMQQQINELKKEIRKK